MIGIERDKRFIYEMIFQFYKVRNENQVSNIVRKHSIDFDDIFQIASIAYLRAENKFNPSKGFKLLTFAGHCIKADLSLFTRDLRAQKRNVSNVRFLYIDDQTNEDDRPLSETIAIEDNSYKNVEDKDLVNYLLGELTDNEKFYIVEHFLKLKTLTQMANEIGVTQVTMFRKIDRVLKKLREVAVG